MKNDTRLLTEIERSKEMMKYTTRLKKKPIVDKSEKQKKTIEEFKIVTLTEFLKG